MAGEWLNEVGLTFVKAFKGPDVVVQEMNGEDGPYKKYIFNALFKDEKGEVKKHKTHSFKPPASVGEVLVGDIKLYHGKGQNGPYVSYTFYPKEGAVATEAPEQPREQKPADKTPPATEAVKRIPLEHRQYAVQKLIRMAYDTTVDIFTDILDGAAANEEKSPGGTHAAGERLGKSFTEIWKASIMSLLKEGQVWFDIMETAGDEWAEAHGMPTNKEVEASEAKPDEKVQSLVEKSGGTVINISSIHAFEGYTEHSVYAGTRGAITAFTRQLAIELAPRGVRVNAIAPGGVPVPNYFKHTPDVDVEQAIKDFGKNIPCGFAGTPDDIANVALFLASEASRYIVAQTLIVDGGTTSWMPFGEQFKQPMTAQFGKGYVPGL